MNTALRKRVAPPGTGVREPRAHLTGWKARLQGLIDARAGTRMNGNVASNRTTEATATVLFDAFNTLHAIGFKLDEPTNFRERHVVALVTYWYEKGAAIKTMQTKMSMLRKFAMWIGKKGSIKPLPYYLKDVPASRLKGTATLTRSKSWTEAGIDIDEKIAQATKLDLRFGLMLELAAAFGLRRKELVMFRPWTADRGDHIEVYANAGPKTGRARTEPVTNDYQRYVLDRLKKHIPKTGALGWTHTRRGKPATLKYQCDEWERRMAQIGITLKDAGVTGHGLRAEVSENALMEQGFIPPTLGGTADQAPREELDLARARVSEMLGHSRLSVMNSYYGSFGRFRTKPEKPLVNPDHAPGRATPAPVASRKVSESGSASNAGKPGVNGYQQHGWRPAGLDGEHSRVRKGAQAVRQADAAGRHLKMSKSDVTGRHE